MKFSDFVRQHWAAFRALLVLTVITGFAYPLLIWAIGQLWLQDKAEGSIVTVNGKPVGSRLIGQLFTDNNGNPVTDAETGRMQLALLLSMEASTAAVDLAFRFGGAGSVYASNPIQRLNLWLSSQATALCGNSVAGFSGLTDLVVVLVIFASLGYVVYRVIRKIFFD